MELDTETVCWLILKAREFDAKVTPVEPDPGSNPSDDSMREVLEDYGDDPVDEEITAAVDFLNIDQQSELVALAWLGRGDGDAAGWDDLVNTARQRHSDHTASYLLGMPRLGDYLEEGLAQLGKSCEDIERARL
jgi:hypothetical protein